VNIEPVQQLVAKHIHGSKPLSNVGTEFSLKLPSSETSKVCVVVLRSFQVAEEMG
jgi:hypothetical protein